MWLGLNMPKGMGCHKFTPGIEQFCSELGDFVNAAQIIQMATYFSIKGAEMRKVKLIVGWGDKVRVKDLKLKVRA